MVDSNLAPDSLELLGLGGLYNGERFTVQPGTSATVGSSSLATHPVGSCRNFRRLAGQAIRTELAEALAAEHVRWLYLGDGRLIVENLAGRDVWAGRAEIQERTEVDLREGPVVVEFGRGERMIASVTGSMPGGERPADERSGRTPAADPLTATLTVHGRPPQPEDIDPPLRLYPDTPQPEAPEKSQAQRPSRSAPEPDQPRAAPTEKPREKRARSRSGGRGAMFFSVLLHVVVVLGLFSYISSGLVPAPGDMTTDVSVVTPTALPTKAPPEPRITEPSPSEAMVSEADLPAFYEEEAMEGFLEGPGIDDAPDSGVPGVPGGGAAIGIGAGGLLGGGVPGGAKGRPAPSGATIRAPLRMALDWLRRHQDENGSWGGISSLKHCPACNGTAKREYRIAETGLATLAFAGAGHTHRKGEFQKTSRMATKFLMDQCRPDGGFHPEATPDANRRMYGQAMAVLALAEVYRQSKSPFIRKVLERGVRFIERAQQPYAGWRYVPGQRSSDISVTGWQVLALSAADRAGVKANPATRSGARDFLRAMTETQTYRVGYNRRGRGSLAMTATGLVMRIHLGGPSTDPAFRGGFRLLAANRPVWPPRGTPPVAGNPPDLYYWYFATLALSRKRGAEWTPWRKALSTALLSHQKTGSDLGGSWAPAGKWEKLGGRVLTTSLGALCLELTDGLKTAFR